ncbi:uncharacterized protein LOC141593136 [Silene latifolia]|uniref:uncharacterized protein LOC141593136 n=1 Tax=Silene latifolia TaxID=37657 RepID=UPI003D76DAF8
MAQNNTLTTSMTSKTTPVTSTISQLKPNVRHQTLLARVVRKWYRPEFLIPNQHSTIEILLLDIEKNIIQATVRKLLVDRFDPRVVEGVAYKITGFKVAENNGSEIATPQPFRLYFEFGTLVLQSPNSPIPRYGFSFQEFGDIIANDSLDKHFIDVVGQFVGVGELKKTTGGHPIKTVKLENIEKEQITCSLWGKYITEIDEFMKTQTASSGPTFMVIQCAQRIIFQGVRIQTSRYAAKIYINPDIPEVDALRKKLNEGNDPVSSRITQITDEHTDILSTDNILSIKEIKNCQRADDYVTLASIDDLESSIGWYYDSCKLCRTKVELHQDNLWHCKRKQCDGFTKGLKTKVPRYQVRYHVVGIENDYAEFTLFDNHIATLVKVTASDLLAAQEKPKIPDELGVFIGKTYVFKVRVKQDFNIEQKSSSYAVVSMSDDPEVISQWEKKYQALQDCSKPANHQTSTESDPIIQIEDNTAQIEDNIASSEMIQIHASSETGETGDTDGQLLDVQDHTPPLKRKVSRMLEVVEDEHDEPSMTDQESATKKIMKIKMEKN